VINIELCEKAVNEKDKATKDKSFFILIKLKSPAHSGQGFY